EVIDYVQGKYGHSQVAQIITFGTLQARAVVRDVGRVLQMPYGQVDRISKLIPANPANPVSLAQALDIEPQLKAMRDSDEQVRDLIAIAQKLEGLYRHASTHAAGIVVGERPLTELVPMYRDPRSDMPVTQYSMKWGARGARQVRLPRPHHAHGAAEGGRDDQPQRHQVRAHRHPHRRRADLRSPQEGRRRRGVPGGKSGHAAGARRHAARPLRGPDRARGALPPGPDGEHPDLLRPQARRRGGRIPASAAGADPRADLRRHHLPGAG